MKMNLHTTLCVESRNDDNIINAPQRTLCAVIFASVTQVLIWVPMLVLLCCG